MTVLGDEIARLVHELKSWGGEGVDKQPLSVYRILAGDLMGLPLSVQPDQTQYINLGQFQDPERFGPGTVNPAMINESGRRVLQLLHLLGYTSDDLGTLAVPSSRVVQSYHSAEPDEENR